MQERLKALLIEAKEGAAICTKKADFETFKAGIVGPNGKLTEWVKSIGTVPKKERPQMGRWLNETKKALEEVFAETAERLALEVLKNRLGPPVDPSLPVPEWEKRGSLHPLSQISEMAVAIFGEIGFSVAEGSEVDTEWFCFDALNTPEDHPARDEQDTLFIKKDISFGNINQRGEEPYLLRTQTSTVQIRTMLATEPPLAIVAPGRSYRRDTVDATHSANFHQIEGLVVGKEVSLKDLKACLDQFVKKLFGESVKTRLRPSFFPFTEPSFELDMNAPDLGKLSNQWIEILGCGMVDPNVFISVGYDPEVWTGYAFGVGVERLAMMRYGIDDIRHFYQNDLRFLRQFSYSES